MNIRKQTIAAIAGTLVLLGIAAACNRASHGKHYGEKIDATAPRVTLAELVSHPDLYEGKLVVVDGQHGGACGDGDFYFKDKFDMIEADPPQPEVASLKKGTPIRLYGLVKVHRAESLKESEAKEAAERKQAGASEERSEMSVKIVGKAVEVLR